MREIPLTQGYTAIVDDADYQRVIDAGPWHAATRPTSDVVYAIRNLKQAPYTVRLHRFVLEITNPNVHVDHRNHNGLDCTRANLRACTMRQNLGNKRKTRVKKSSRYKGVSWRKESKSWAAQIRPLTGKIRFLGYFAVEEDAARAYDKAALEIFGEFAATNEMLQTCTENG